MIPIGRNEKGQLGHGDTKRVEAPKLIEVLGSEAIVLAACGRNHTLALTGGEKPQQNALKLLIFALVSWLFPILVGREWLRICFWGEQNGAAWSWEPNGCCSKPYTGKSTLFYAFPFFFVGVKSSILVFFH